MGCVTVLQSKLPVECLTYTQKEPILFFSGHSDGMILKWEQQQSSYFLYSHEMFNMFEIQSRGVARHNTIKLRRNASQRKAHSADHLVNAALNGDKESPAVAASKKTTQPPSFTRFEVLLEQSINRRCSAAEEENASVNNRVSGFVCKKVLSHHIQPVGGVAVVGRDQGYSTDYLISGGWDRRICVWDLQACVLHDIFSNTAPDERSNVQELACDGAILDLAYSPKRNEFAYSSSDGMIYIRHFSPTTSQMKLVSVLQGHEADVTAILWHSLLNKWLSGSEDGSIRLWNEDGTKCEQILVANGAVNCLCIDRVNGCILAGIQESLRVYDPESFTQVQRNIGHMDSIRSIIHIPERSQYVTASWDRTLRIWNSYVKPLPKSNDMRENAAAEGKLQQDVKHV
ncbi:hypothetical protein chiPu_0020018 [Chiloscyllium punctatum]|uniref:Uncharacterized protein n=1 Tax=Chiloscyllium punctatum TaxID=137246 RepID=A0A401RTV3_CHIPU|nr:hypothetical protein [Chiloscyllium punctatum]